MVPCFYGEVRVLSIHALAWAGVLRFRAMQHGSVSMGSTWGGRLSE